MSANTCKCFKQDVWNYTKKQKSKFSSTLGFKNLNVTSLFFFKFLEDCFAETLVTQKKYYFVFFLNLLDIYVFIYFNTCLE